MFPVSGKIQSNYNRTNSRFKVLYYNNMYWFSICTLIIGRYQIYSSPSRRTRFVSTIDCMYLQDSGASTTPPHVYYTVLYDALRCIVTLESTPFTKGQIFRSSMSKCAQTCRMLGSNGCWRISQEVLSSNPPGLCSFVFLL